MYAISNILAYISHWQPVMIVYNGLIFPDEISEYLQV